MASSEVERISGLKTKVSQAYEEVQNQRDKEEKQRDKITVLRGEIAQLKVQREENIELTEEETLKLLKEQFEDLVKAKEEQEETFERVRHRNKDLQEKRQASEQDIIDHMRTIDELNRQMRETRNHKMEKENEKKQLNEDTVTIRQQIEEQKGLLQEKQAAIEVARGETLREDQNLKAVQMKLDQQKMDKAHLEDERRRLTKALEQQDKKNGAQQVALEKEQMKLNTQERTVKDLKHELKTKVALLKKAEKEYAPMAT